MRAFAPGTAACLATLLLAPSASGFARSTTSRGAPLWWEETEVTFHFDCAGSADLPDDDSEWEACRRSFASWEAVECGYGPFRMRIFEEECIEDGAVEYLRDDPNLNVIKWVEARPDWGHSLDVIGVTSVTYDANSGRILDADIEFNGVRFTYTTTDSPLHVKTDVENSCAHEVGHFFGLDHTSVSGATMEGRAPDGEVTKRSLQKDDADGVCNVLPSAPTSDDDNGGGWVCGASGIGGGGDGGAPRLPALAMAALLALAARRRQRTMAETYPTT